VILVDTSIWVDHLRHGDEQLAALLDRGMVLMHPFIMGELALGQLRQRQAVLTDLMDLPAATVAGDDEAMRLIEQEALYGMGVGYIDAHLLAAARLTPGAMIWTRDRRFLVVAEKLSLAARVVH
jgi:predicted nucleic acid-binding protein